MPHLLLAATAVASILLSFATGSVAQTVPPGTVAPKVPAETAAPKVAPDLPLAIICLNEQTKEWRVGYLYVVREDGSALYVAPALGELGVEVNAKGLVETPTDRPASVDCFGKTVKELRAAGRVMEFNAQVARRPERAL
jgi:hypothetical protein